MPAKLAPVAGQNRVLGAQLGGVGPDQGMAVQPAGDELPVELTTGARLGLGSGCLAHVS